MMCLGHLEYDVVHVDCFDVRVRLIGLDDCGWMMYVVLACRTADSVDSVATHVARVVVIVVVNDPVVAGARVVIVVGAGDVVVRYRAAVVVIVVGVYGVVVVVCSAAAVVIVVVVGNEKYGAGWCAGKLGHNGRGRVVRLRCR